MVFLQWSGLRFFNAMKKRILILLVLLISGCSPKMNIVYLNEPHLVPFERFDFRLSKDFIVGINYDVEVIPKNFVTDLASIPRFLWSIYSPNDTDTIRAAILHDYMYRCDTGYTRKEADNIFYYALRKSGVNRWKANKYYYAVRLLGWKFWQSGKC